MTTRIERLTKMITIKVDNYHDEVTVHGYVSNSIPGQFELIQPVWRLCNHETELRNTIDMEINENFKH